MIAIAYEFISTADNQTVMRCAVDVSTADGLAAVLAYPTGGRYVMWDAGDWRDATEQESADVVAAIEAERLATLIADHAPVIGALGQALAAFGLAMPIDPDDAIAAMYMGVKQDVTKTADSQMANICYMQLQQAGVSNDDMAAVWLAITGGA